MVDERLEAHAYAFCFSFPETVLTLRRSPVNRIANCFGNLLASGDDDGLIKVRCLTLSCLYSC